MENQIDIYTDASYYSYCHRRKYMFGYSSVILDKDRDYIINGSITHETIKRYFKLDDNLEILNTNHGELIAICKSLWQFRNESQNIRIFSDSKFSLNMIVNVMNGEFVVKKAENRENYNNLVKFIIDIIDKIDNNGGSVELFWIKGHMGCYGNEVADKMAKRSIDFKSLKKEIPSINSVKRHLSKLGDDHFYNKEYNEFLEYKNNLVNYEREVVKEERVKYSISYVISKLKIYKSIFTNFSKLVFK